MGYGIQVAVGYIVIEAAKIDAALEAINDLFRTGETYSWCRGPDNVFEGYTNIHEAFEDWSFRAKYATISGDIRVMHFTGEKLGDDERLWEALAPFITSIHHAEHQNSWLIYTREDGEKWRYNFVGGKMVEEHCIFESDNNGKVSVEELTEERTKRVEAQIEVIELKKKIAALKAMLGPNFKG